MKILSVLFAASIASQAQFLSIDLTVQGMDCVSCVSGLDARLKRLRGVESVSSDAAKSLVSLKLADSNSVRLERIRDDVKGVGFTPGKARIVAAGTAVKEAAGFVFLIPSTGQRYALTGSTGKFTEALNSGRVLRIEAYESPGPTPQDPPIMELISLTAK